MAINSRSKGQRGEREVRDLLQSMVDLVAKEKNMLFAPEVKRNLFQSMEGGHDLVGIPGLAVEVKFVESSFQKKWWDQTLEQARRVKGLPVLLWRRAHQPWRVMMQVRIPVADTFHACDATVDLKDFEEWLYQYLHDKLDKNV